MLLSYLIGLILLVWIFLFYNVHSLVWFMAATIILAVSSYTSHHQVALFCVYAVFCAVYLVLAFRPIRRNLITKLYIDKIRKLLPKISTTESQAIEAGDVWWEGNIFAGDLDWQKFKDHKLTLLRAEEQEFLDIKVNKLCALVNEWEITQNKDLSLVAWDYLKKNQFLALHIPKQYGGLEFSATASSTIVAKIASQSATAAVTVMVPNSLGPAELLMHYGTEEQKLYYLPRLANGDEIPCFALTSEHAGSDAGGMVDTGVICREVLDGKEIIGIKLNFAKRYITLAPVATVMGLAFKLYDPDLILNKNSGTTDLGVTLALIPTNCNGIEIGKRHFPMMVPFQNGPIYGENVFIPLDYIIGGVDYIGKGWFMLMECLSAGRGISLPALSNATTQVSYFSSIIYSQLRMQFKTPIANLEGIQEQLALLTGFSYLSNAVRLATVSAIDHGLKPAVVSAITKYHLTELSRKAINCAMDIHGGKGVMNGPSNYLISHYLANPVAITVEGANILTRNLIIFGQGAFRAHPYVLEEITALNERNASYGLRQFDKVLFQHIKFVFSTLTRLKTYNLQRIYYSFTKRSNWLAAYKKDLTRLSCALAVATDFALLFVGGKLKIKERLSARLGDVVSYIFMALCVIKHYEDVDTTEFNTDSSEKRYLAQWSLEYCIYNAQEALVDYIDNFPKKTIRCLLRLVIFPWGVKYKKPSDQLDAKIVALNYSPDKKIFEQLSSLAYTDKSSALEILKITYNLHIEYKSILEKLYNLAAAKKINYSNNLKNMLDEAYNKHELDLEDYEKLSVYNDNLRKIISVNEFNQL